MFSKNKTPKEFRTVTIEEYWKREKDGTYWYWRFAGTKEWNKVLTPYEEMPYFIPEKLKCGCPRFDKFSVCINQEHLRA